MIACYDLANCPPTYDVVAFLAMAEKHRLEVGADGIELHLLPGPVGGFRRDSLWPHSIEEREALLQKIVVPMCGMLPSVKGVYRDKVRPPEIAGAYGHDQYLISLPRIIEAYRAGIRPLRAKPGLKAKKDRITFTLRESAHHPQRNSNLQEWLSAARILRDRGFTVFIIRDTLKAHEDLPGGFYTAAGAAADLQFRAQVYGSSVLNVGVNNGPMWFALFLDVPVLMLKPVTDSMGGCYGTHYFTRCGIRRGGQLPNAPTHQRLVWQEDTAANIVNAVKDMLLCLG